MKKEELRKHCIKITDVESLNEVWTFLRSIGELAPEVIDVWRRGDVEGTGFRVQCVRYGESIGKKCWHISSESPSISFEAVSQLFELEKPSLEDYSIEELEAHIQERKNNQKVVRWVNVYSDGNVGLYNVKEGADSWAGDNRLRCVRIEV